MLTFYKPNKSVKGSLANFSFKSKGDKKGVFVELVKQVSWDSQNSKGSFSGGEKVNIKLSLIEVGALIRSIENNVNASTNERGFYHQSEKGSATIFFGPYIRDEKQVGFSFSVSKQDSSGRKNFVIGFDFNEATTLREFLKFALEHVFSGLYSDAIKAASARKESSDTDPQG